MTGICNIKKRSLFGRLIWPSATRIWIIPNGFLWQNLVPRIL